MNTLVNIIVNGLVKYTVNMNIIVIVYHQVNYSVNHLVTTSRELFSEYIT